MRDTHAGVGVSKHGVGAGCFAGPIGEISVESRGADCKATAGGGICEGNGGKGAVGSADVVGKISELAVGADCITVSVGALDNLEVSGGGVRAVEDALVCGWIFEEG